MYIHSSMSACKHWHFINEAITRPAMIIESKLRVIFSYFTTFLNVCSFFIFIEFHFLSSHIYNAHLS